MLLKCVIFTTNLIHVVVLEKCINHIIYKQRAHKKIRDNFREGNLFRRLFLTKVCLIKDCGWRSCYRGENVEVMTSGFQVFLFLF